MKTYVVGGAVRDELLGLPVQDRDHVVVGATPEQMLARAFARSARIFRCSCIPTRTRNMRWPAPSARPRPATTASCSIPRPDVTLEDDLVRRDLTINAMARAEDGHVDPYGGQRDLQARIFRHVSDAFAEDPVRILRLARFAARFPISAWRRNQCADAQMVEEGEVDALVPERVWQELSRGLMEQKPSRMFEVLRDCGALARILPELDKLWGVPQITAMKAWASGWWKRSASASRCRPNAATWP
jgi:tRNA nucleotidyltransferase (CCA-adding enzyme)